jgi:hypothetical protein
VVRQKGEAKLNGIVLTRSETISLDLVIFSSADSSCTSRKHDRYFTKLKPEVKRPIGRPRRRRFDNIRMDLLEIGLSVVDWIGLAQDRDRWRDLVNSVMNLRVP